MIRIHLLVNGINNIFQEQTLQEQAGRHFDSGFYAAMKILKEEGIVVQVEMKGKIWYGITIFVIVIVVGALFLSTIILMKKNKERFLGFSQNNNGS